MANKGKKKQKKPLHSIHLQDRISQRQEHQKACDLKYQVQEDLEKHFVDWDEIPEAEQEDILEREIKLAEEAIKKAELKKYLDTLPAMDPNQPQASSSSLPATAPPAPLTNDDIRNILIVLSTNMHKLTDHVLILTTQVTNMSATQTAAATAGPAAAAPIHPKSKDNIKRLESWKGKGSSANAQYFLAAFSNWAFHMEDQLNDWDAASSSWVQNDTKWIQSVLNLMDEDARTWILPHLEELRRGTILFTSSWRQFEREFIK